MFKSIFNIITLHFLTPYAFHDAFIYSIWSVQSAFSFYISQASNGKVGSSSDFENFEIISRCSR